MIKRLKLFARKHWGLLRLALATSAAITLIRPGDILILKTTTPLASRDKQRIHDHWRALGGDISVAIIDGHWDMTIARPLTPHQNQHHTKGTS